MADPLEHLKTIAAANLEDGRGFGVAVIWEREADESTVTFQGRFQELEADEVDEAPSRKWQRRGRLTIVLDVTLGLALPLKGDTMTITSFLTAAAEEWAIDRLEGSDGPFAVYGMIRGEPELHARPGYRKGSS